MEALDDDQSLGFYEDAGRYRRRIGLDLMHSVGSTIVGNPATIEDYIDALQAILDRDIRFLEAGE